MEIKKEQTINIEFKGKEADDFRSAVKKLSAETNKVGFNNSSLTSDEKSIIKDLAEKV